MLYYQYIPYISTSTFTPLCFYTLKSHKDIRDVLSESEEENVTRSTLVSLKFPISISNPKLQEKKKRKKYKCNLTVRGRGTLKKI